MSYPALAIFLLGLIPVIYFASFSSRLLHGFICVLLVADGFLGGTWLNSRIIYLYGWEDLMGHGAYFWEPLFNTLGISLKEDFLFKWGSFASSAFPLVICISNINFLATMFKITFNTEDKKTQLRDWRNHKALLGMIFIALTIVGFYLVKGFSTIAQQRAERLEQEKQEFLHHLEAAVNGDVTSMARVGIHYWFGDGTEYNTEEALRWLEKSAQNGVTDAMALLGKAYYAGYRTGRDWDKARYWLTAAINAAPESRTAYEREVLDRINKGLLPFSVGANSIRKK